MVAVKIKYKGIDESVKGDLRVLRRFQPLFKLIYKNHNIKGITDFYASTVETECDFRNEANNIPMVSRLFINQPDIHVPEVYEDLSTKNIITTEFFDAESLYDYLERVDDEKKDKIVEKLKRYYYYVLDNGGLIQLDPHFGNFLVKNDELICVDFGSYTRVNEDTAKIFRAMVKYSREQDSLAMYKLLCEAGILKKSKISLAQFEKLLAPALFRPFALNKEGIRNIFQSYEDQLKEPLRGGVVDSRPDLPFLWFTYLIFLSLFERVDNNDY